VAPGTGPLDVMSRDVVDLYTLRCAVATVVHARHHVEQLERTDLVLLDHAVAHLTSVSDDLHGEMATAARALLSTQPDPTGQRTVRSIDRLAELTHVDAVNAHALAAQLSAATRPKQQRLFEA
jgi:hypothetical protein